MEHRRRDEQIQSWSLYISVTMKETNLISLFHSWMRVLRIRMNSCIVFRALPSMIEFFPTLGTFTETVSASERKQKPVHVLGIRLSRLDLVFHNRR